MRPKKTAEPLKITKAFLKHVQRQMERATLQLVEAAYEQGCHDENEACAKLAMKEVWKDGAVQTISKRIRDRRVPIRSKA